MAAGAENGTEALKNTLIANGGYTDDLVKPDPAEELKKVLEANHQTEEDKPTEIDTEALKNTLIANGGYPDDLVKSDPADEIKKVLEANGGM